MRNAGPWLGDLLPMEKQCGPELMLHAMRGERINKIHAEQDRPPIQRLRVCQRELYLPEEHIYPNICHDEGERAISIRGKMGKGQCYQLEGLSGQSGVLARHHGRIRERSVCL